MIIEKEMTAAGIEPETFCEYGKNQLPPASITALIFPVQSIRHFREMND